MVCLSLREKEGLKEFELVPQFPSGIKIVDLVSYLTILNSSSFASIMLTDSSGIQKEALSANSDWVVDLYGDACYSETIAQAILDFW